MPRTAAAGAQDPSSPARSFVGLLVSAAPGGSISTGSGGGGKNSQQLTPLELTSEKNAPANSAATFDWMTTVRQREEKKRGRELRLPFFFDPLGQRISVSFSSSPPFLSPLSVFPSQQKNSLSRPRPTSRSTSSTSPSGPSSPARTAPKGLPSSGSPRRSGRRPCSAVLLLAMAAAAAPRRFWAAAAPTGAAPCPLETPHRPCARAAVASPARAASRGTRTERNAPPGPRAGRRSRCRRRHPRRRRAQQQPPPRPTRSRALLLLLPRR